MKAEFLEQLLISDKLPSLPVVATKILTLSNDPDSSLSDFSNLISCDVALATQIVKVANSAYYARRQPVVDVGSAVQLIGLSAVVSLVITFSMKGLLDSSSSKLNLDPFWKRSILLSSISAFLSRYVRGVSREEALLAGLIQDVGILAVSAVFPEYYENTHSFCIYDHDQLIVEEQAIFGSNHSSVGAFLLRNWDMPASIIDAVLNSHDTPGRVLDLNWCVAGANALAPCISRGIQGQNLYGEISSGLSSPWLGLDRDQIDNAVMMILEIVSETEVLFEVKILPQDINDIIKNIPAEIL